MSRDSANLVSVVIPTYYRNEQLREAIETVERQDYEPVEIIVVDDSGEQHAESTVREYDVNYVPHEVNRGGNAARNTGFERADGDYVQFLDDDDQLRERKFSAQVGLLQSEDEVGVVYCGVEHDTGSVILPDSRSRGNVLEQALSFDITPCMTSTMLLERNVVELVSPLKVRPSADDLGFMIELALITRFDFVNEPLVVKSVQTDSRGQGVINARERLRIIDEYEQLYEELPPRVREETLSETYHRLGAHSLNERLWSATAVWAYWNALRYNPDPGVPNYLSCLMVLFGRPGRNVANRIRRRVIE